MKDFKNKNGYGNMKTEDEAYDGILLKRGDEGYRYYSSSNSSTSSASSTSSGGSNGSSSGSSSGSASGSHNCSYCLGTGWFNSSTNCSHCDAWRTNLAPISYTYSYEASTDEGMSVCISGVCGNAQNMYIYDYTSLNSSFVQSEHASANRIKRTMTFTPGTHYVKIKATSTACGSAEQQFTLKITEKSYDCTYCKDTGKTSTGVCTHCDACPESLLKVTWNEEEIEAINGTDKAYVPVTAEANAGEPIYLRIVVEDAETDETVWRSRDLSTQSFTASSCNLQNGTYNVYAVMTVLSNMTERVSVKRELRVTAVNLNCNYCKDTGKTNTGVCTHCDACPEDLLRVTWNEEEIEAINGTDKAYVPITAEANTNYEPIWIRIVVEDAETNEEIWRSRDLSTQSFTTSSCNLQNGTYNVYAVMTVLSNMKERVSAKKELRVMNASSGSSSEAYPSPTYVIEHSEDIYFNYGYDNYTVTINATCENADRVEVEVANEEATEISGASHRFTLDEGTYTVVIRAYIGDDVVVKTTLYELDLCKEEPEITHLVNVHNVKGNGAYDVQFSASCSSADNIYLWVHDMDNNNNLIYSASGSNCIIDTAELYPGNYNVVIDAVRYRNPCGYCRYEERLILEKVEISTGGGIGGGGSAGGDDVIYNTITLDNGIATQSIAICLI